MGNKFIVMTSATTPAMNCWGRYKRVAVVETDGVNMPRQIHPRHNAVIRIVQTWENCHVGKTERCAFARAEAEALILAEQLNAGN